MAKPQKKKSAKAKKPTKLKDVELAPDAWNRFEKAIDKIVPPKRRNTAIRKSRPTD
jgi:hypothetical protein